LNDKTSLHFDYTYFNYLATGRRINGCHVQNPTQSNRARNWFAVDWNLFALKLEHKFNNDADFSLQLFGLDANRKQDIAQTVFQVLIQREPLEI
jgi:Fe(3+) dicitrate transport protein